MATPFSEPYKKFLSMIQDSGLSLMTDEDMEETKEEYLDTAKSLHFKNCTKDLDDVDLVAKVFNPDLTREEINILACGMVLAWLEPKINTDEIIEQQMGSRDFKVTSSQAHLTALMKLRDKTNKSLKEYKHSYDYNDFTGF